MSKSVPAECVFLTVRELTADCQLVFQELRGLKQLISVEQFKQNYSHLPHCGGTSPVGTMTDPLWRDMISGTCNAQTLF